MITNNPVFKIGQTVYHRTKESEEGLIVDIIYYYSTNDFRYLVSLGFEREVYCKEYELTNEKIY